MPSTGDDEVDDEEQEEDVDDLGALWIPFTSTRELRAPAMVPNGFLARGTRGVGKSRRITLSTDDERRLQLTLLFSSPGKTRSTGTSSPSLFLILSIFILRAEPTGDSGAGLAVSEEFLGMARVSFSSSTKWSAKRRRGASRLSLHGGDLRRVVDGLRERDERDPLRL